MASKPSELEKKLFKIADIVEIGSHINIAEDAMSRQVLYHNLASILSGGDEESYKNAYGDIRISPEEAFRYASEGASSRAEEVKHEYLASKDAISGEVIGAIRADVASAGSKAEAAVKVALYFKNLRMPSKLDQVTADNYAQMDVAGRLGVGINFSARGSISAYQHQHLIMEARRFGVEYLKDIKDKDGKVTGYELDEEKLKKELGNALTGAIMYKNTKDILKAKEEAKKKK